MSAPINLVETSINLATCRHQVWKKVCFYEHVKKKPSLLLRLALPTPAKTEGHYQSVGDVSRCRYSDGGYLTKRLTDIVDCRRIQFEIIEQSIRYKSHIQLLGGFITLDDCYIPMGEGASNLQGTRVTMRTYYRNCCKPNWLTRFFIDRVIKSMHRFVMHDMREQLEVAEVKSWREQVV